MENFPCGPSKIPMLKRKLTETINMKVDPDTMVLKVDCTKPENSEAAPCRTRKMAVLDEALISEIDEVISNDRKEENLRYLRTEVPYFKDFDDDEFYTLMDKVRLVYYVFLGAKNLFFWSCLLIIFMQYAFVAGQARYI